MKISSNFAKFRPGIPLPIVNNWSLMAYLYHIWDEYLRAQGEVGTLSRIWPSLYKYVWAEMIHWKRWQILKLEMFFILGKNKQYIDNLTSVNPLHVCKIVSE